MNNETSKTSAPAAASPLTAKPDLVKNIGGTTFDIHIHFSETSPAMKPLKSKILFSCSLLTKPEGYYDSGGGHSLSACRLQNKNFQYNQFPKIHAL